MNIQFEPNFYDETLEPNGKCFDCFYGELLVGRFEVFRNHFLKNKQEIYIETFIKKAGYARSIYENFMIKSGKLGFKRSTFYAVVTASNKRSLKLHNKMSELVLGFDKFEQTKDVTIYKIEGAVWNPVIK